MKKNRSFNTQNLILAFVLGLTTIKAAEQTNSDQSCYHQSCYQVSMVFRLEPMEDTLTERKEIVGGLRYHSFFHQDFYKKTVVQLLKWMAMMPMDPHEVIKKYGS
ncbi:MAG: hypothetical protein KBD31_04710 [Proteobacteria bacterium]|nr:hypothetical protein [Pseudomonadota bacterium]